MRKSASAPFFFLFPSSSSSSQAAAGALMGWRTAMRPVERHLSRPATKLVLAATISFFTFFLLISSMSTTTSSVSPWLPAPTLPLRHPRHPASRRGYSILMNTWKRDDLLKQSITHYSSCSGLESIHIVWSEPNPPSNSLRDFMTHTLRLKHNIGQEIEIKFDLNEENSLNNRFKEIKDLRTDAILSIDDDVILPCSSVEFAFNVWRSAPNVMVGFVPRMHWFDKSNGSIVHYKYGGWWSVWWRGTYSMVLSKAAFFHRRYLAIYTNEMQASIRDYITLNRNCEDIAMSFLVANVSQAPPIWVKGSIYETGSTGISSLGGHSERRAECLNDFAAIYGHMPLIATHVKAVDSRDSWFW